MNKIFLYYGICGAIIILSSTANALPVSQDDLWQDATITAKSSEHSVGPMANMFDGNEGGYGYENGNALFADYGTPAGFTHWVEWSTNTSTTVNSLNLIAYHDFDERDINNRGFGEFNLYYDDGGIWIQAFNWEFTDPNGDQHYGGGPSYNFVPDTHDMNRSYLELTANLDTAITSQFFRAEFVQYGNTGGPRVVELDGYGATQSIPEPATIFLLGSAFIGLIGTARNYK